MRSFFSMVPFVVVVGLTTPASAQGDPRDHEEKRDEMRDRMQHKMQAYVTAELSSRLGLDEKKTLKLSATVRSHMEKRHERQKKLADEAQKLRGLVEGKASDAEVKKQLDVVLGAAGHEQDIRDLMNESATYLSVTEQAKLALAIPEIIHDVRRMMHEQMGPMGPMKGKMMERHGGFLEDDE